MGRPLFGDQSAGRRRLPHPGDEVEARWSPERKSRSRKALSAAGTRVTVLPVRQSEQIWWFQCRCFLIIGIVVVFGCVVAGYLMEHGNLKVLMQPAELIIILGAAIGTVLIANPLFILMKIGSGLAGAFGGSPFNKQRYSSSQVDKRKAAGWQWLFRSRSRSSAYFKPRPQKFRLKRTTPCRFKKSKSSRILVGMPM